MRWFSKLFVVAFLFVGAALAQNLGPPSGAISPAPIVNSLSADKALNNSTYTDGPSIAQGTTGTWYVVGNVNILDTAGTFQVFCKLWDGTSIIDSRVVQGTVANDVFTAGLAGFLASPAGNLRISCISNATTTTFKFNASGNSKDTTISGYRIQ